MEELNDDIKMRSKLLLITRISVIFACVADFRKINAFLPSRKMTHRKITIAGKMPNISILNMARSSSKRRGKNSRKASKKAPKNLELIYPTVESMPKVRPKLLVFDLDNTLWTPELYQIRQKNIPKAGSDIWLFDGAQTIVHDLARNPGWEGTSFAIASRTNKADWAETLLRKFEACSGTSLSTLFPHKQIVTGSKRKHFENLKAKTNIPFSEMIFYDDDMHLNIGEISSMGVLCCHCPQGMTVDLFKGSLEKFHKLKSNSDDVWMGAIVTKETIWEEDNFQNQRFL